MNYNYDITELSETLDTLRGVSVEQVCASTLQRIKNMPLAYLEFGPYWWAVKRVLAKNGYNLGLENDETLLARFTLANDMLTLLAGWRCADEYREYYFHGTRSFLLDVDAEEDYTLYDSDMEGGRHAG